MHTLQEKNACLRERVMELSGVVSRWKEDFTAQEESKQEQEWDQENEEGGESSDSRATKALQEAHATEMSLRTLSEQQRHRVAELEEALAAALGQVSHWEERDEGLRGVMEELRRGEADFKHRAAVQVSRVKQVGDKTSMSLGRGWALFVIKTHGDE